MKKHIIAMAVAAAVAAPAAAIADTTLYGKIHASYDFWGGDVADNADYSLASNSSRIGIKGKEAITENLSLIYQWENELDWGGDNAAGLKSSDTRNTFIGFTGNWGTMYAGAHDTPFKDVRGKYDLFGDTVGDARSILRGRSVGGSDNNWDQRYNNTVAYITPDVGGLQATVAYVSDTKTNINNDSDAVSANVAYEVGGFGIIAGYEKHNRSEVAGEEDSQSAYRVAAQYKMGGFKVMGLYQGVENVNYMTEAQAAAGAYGGEMDMWGAGAAYSFGKSMVKAHYFQASEVDSVADSGADLWAIGYDYKLSKQTKIYAAYAAMSNESGIGSYAVGYKTGHGESAAVDTADLGNDNNAFSLGLVHKF